MTRDRPTDERWQKPDEDEPGHLEKANQIVSVTAEACPSGTSNAAVTASAATRAPEARIGRQQRRRANGEGNVEAPELLEAWAVGWATRRQEV